MKINGETRYLWRAVDHEGEILEAFVSKRRNRKAALKFLKKAMRRNGRPEQIVTDRFPSFRPALRDLGGALFRSQAGGSQPRGELTPASPTTRAGDAALPANAKSSEIRCRPRLRLQPLQPRDAGHEVLGIAADEQEALSLAEDTRPDLALVDIRLARGGDGTKVAREMFERWAIRSIFVFAHGEQEIRNRGLAADAVGLVVKPYTPDALLNAIERATPQLVPR